VIACPVPQQPAVVLAAIKAELFEWSAFGGPALTAAARDGARIERPGQENGSGGAELENWTPGIVPHRTRPCALAASAILSKSGSVLTSVDSHKARPHRPHRLFFG